MPRVKLLPKQNAFRRAQTKWAGARGGVGSGKTTGACWWMLQRLEDFPKAAHFVVGADYEQLRRGFFQTLIGLLENVLGWEAGKDFRYRETPSPMLTLSHNGARLRALSAEQAERIRSVEVQSLYCEEPPTWNNGETVFRVLVGRLRHSQRSGQMYPSMTPQGRMTFNPPAVGTWLYKLIEEEWPKHGWPCFRMSLRENVLIEGHKDYIGQLEAMYPPDLWPVEIDGEWASVGGNVYRYFDARMHGQAPEGMPSLQIDEAKPLLWALDFNVGWMSSIIGQFHVQSQVQSGWDVQPGRPPRPQYRNAVEGWQPRILYVLRELFLKDSGTPDVVEFFIKHYGQIARRTGVILYGDASGSNRGHTRSATEAAQTSWEIVADALIKAGIRVISRVPFSNPSVLNRVNEVNAQFRSGEGYGMVVDLQSCPNLVDDFYGVKFKPGTNEIDKDNKTPEGQKRTHLSDALGYLIWVERRLAQSQQIAFRDFINR